MKITNLKVWLGVIKVLLWISVIGFGLTFLIVVRVTITSNDMRAEVNLNKSTVTTIGTGKLDQNSGVYTFKSENVLDKLIFRHTYANWDFIQSLFTFVTCCILLRMINGVNTESPFTPKIARYIMIIGFIFIGYGLINVGAAFYERWRVMQLTNLIALRYITFPADLTYIKSGVFILLFSFIYRIGVTYQEENQLTV